MLAKVLAVLVSPRKKGYTAGLLEHAIEGIRMGNVEVEKIYLPDYALMPCRSCFQCIRDEEHYCVMKDDMGSKGAGRLIPKILGANGMIIADPVYCWNISARAHLFLERLYSLQWSGKISGMPFASISCATNQGMMREAAAQIAKMAFTYKFRYIDGISAHAANYESACKQSYYAGEKLAKAAVEDEKGRKPLSDIEAFKEYSDTLWCPSEHYIDNLTSGGFNWRESLVYRALSEGRFASEEGKSNLEKASAALRELLREMELGSGDKVLETMVKTSAYWTEATWHEYVKSIVNAGKPKVYRPVEE